MKIYRWSSEALKQYQCGDILALGSTVEEARAVARRHFERQSTEHYADMIKWAATGEWSPSEDDIERRDKMLRMFEADISREPESSDAYFIAGSE